MRQIGNCTDFTCHMLARCYCVRHEKEGNVVCSAFHKFVSRIGVQLTLSHAVWNSK